MVEWFKAAVLKTAEAQVSEGSNPSLSAIFMLKFRVFSPILYAPVWSGMMKLFAQNL